MITSADIIKKYISFIYTPLLHFFNLSINFWKLHYKFYFEYKYKQLNFCQYLGGLGAYNSFEAAAGYCVCNADVAGCGTARLFRPSTALRLRPQPSQFLCESQTQTSQMESPICPLPQGYLLVSGFCVSVNRSFET